MDLVVPHNGSVQRRQSHLILPFPVHGLRDKSPGHRRCCSRGHRGASLSDLFIAVEISEFCVYKCGIYRGTEKFQRRAAIFFKRELSQALSAHFVLWIMRGSRHGRHETLDYCRTDRIQNTRLYSACIRARDFELPHQLSKYKHMKKLT